MQKSPKRGQHQMPSENHTRTRGHDSFVSPCSTQGGHRRIEPSTFNECLIYFQHERCAMHNIDCAQMLR